MTFETLGFISREMERLELEYELMRFTSSTPSMYYVGEYTEVEPLTEDGGEETNFILTGTTTGPWLLLERAKEAIKQNFDSISGKTFKGDSGMIAVVFYCSSFPVPTMESDLKRIQINLKIKEWKVK